MLGQVFIPIFAVFLLMFVIGIVMAIIWKKKKPEEYRKAEEMLSQRTVDNVNDLNDRFNRARYMDQDGN